MKRIIGVAVAMVFAGLFVAGCADKGPEPPSKAQAILEGEHKLRKMVERTDAKTSTSGGFFLFVGGFDSSAKTSVTVKFAWQMNDGTYAISSLPLEKIRVKLDDGAAVPTIKFRWLPYDSYRRTTPRVQELMDRFVLYAVVTARERDWPVHIQLPLNN
ncbi:MAG: hypothetical protein Q8Q41_03035 [bacterium]|nr:hypothetical protein [bacterium]